MHCYYTNNSAFQAPTYFTEFLQGLSGLLEAYIFKKMWTDMNMMYMGETGLLKVEHFPLKWAKSIDVVAERGF